MKDITLEPPQAPVVLARAGFLAHRPALELAFGLAVFEIAFYVAYRYGMEFSPTLSSPFWLPDSVLLCALLRSRPKHWWLFILAPLPIRLFTTSATEMPLWFLLGCYAVDSGKGLVAAFLLRRVIANPIRLQTPGEFAWFGLIAVLLAPAIFAFAGAGLRNALGTDVFWAAWQRWFLGDATAQLVATPAILYWAFRKPPDFAAISPLRAVEGALLAIALMITSDLAFSTSIGTLDLSASRVFVPIPFLFWAALRFGMGGASAAVPVITFFAVRAALERRGMFVNDTPAQTAVALQDFLILRAVPVYLVAALVEQWEAVRRSLSESEARFRTVANATPMLLWTADLDGRTEFVNDGWRRFTGRSPEEEVGEGWKESLHPDDVDRCNSVFATAIVAQTPFECEYRLKRHDGVYRWMLDVGVPRHDPDGAFAGFVGSALDITDRKQTEEVSRSLAHIHRLALLGELTAAIAHEVRQPLSAIMMNASAAGRLLARTDPPIDELRTIMSEIAKDDRRANEVLVRIREFLQKREPPRNKLDVNNIVREVFRFVHGDAVRRRVDIAMQLAHDLPLVHGDSTQLQQVLLNLIINGMDAMDTLPPSERRLMLRTERDNGDVKISVVDRGSGIDSDGLPRLFDAFFTTKGHGMGLGLSIAESIVRAHNGRIWAENNPERGATFHFSVPTKVA
jgi:PAS domain S-box-containing protein